MYFGVKNPLGEFGGERKKFLYNCVKLVTQNVGKVSFVPSGLVFVSKKP